MTEAQTIEQRVKFLEREIRELKKEKDRAHWVKVGTVTATTGWTRERLRRARDFGEIEFKKTDKGFFYNLDSLHPAMFKVKQAS